MIFGNYEYKRFFLEDLVILPQVRKAKNAKLDDLVESIAITGLINPLDVAKLNYEEMNKHINFLNKLWNKSIDINCLKSIDGFFYVLISGHSRLEALKINARNNGREDEVEVKIHKVSSSEGILAIQLSENIYKEPRIEERAIAIIETYYFGLECGKWQDKETFINENANKFSRKILSEALSFSDLPAEVQEYVFSENIFFAAGVELGKLSSLIEKYEETFADNEECLETNIKLHYAIILMKLQKAGSVKKSLSIIASHRKELVDYFRPKEDVQEELFNYWQESANRQGEARFKQLLFEYNSVTNNIKGIPLHYFIELFKLSSDLTGVDHSLDVYDIKKLYHRCSEDHFTK